MDDLERVLWADRIDGVLQAGGPCIAYQPIVDLWSDHRVVGHEALSRFPDARPDAYFEAAHATGQADELELAAVRNALAGSPVGGRRGYVSINLCPHAICADELAGLLAGVPAHTVLLEVTEHVRVDSYDQLRGCLAPLRIEGMRLAVDDLGAGWASFLHVLELAPDAIKLDRALVAGCDAREEQDKQALIAAMAMFAARVGCRMVAEGVETEAEAETLRYLGVRYGQGYLFGAPQVPVIDLT